MLNVSLNFDDERLKKIGKDFNKLGDRFLKPKIKEIRINLLELEESFSQLKRYYDYDDIQYKGIRGIGRLFNQSTDEDYYKPIRTVDAFDNKNNCMKYETKGDKSKFINQKYLNMIRTYLSDMINNHKIYGKLNVHSGNKIIDYRTSGE